MFALSLFVANLGQAKVTEVDLSSAVGIWLFDEGTGDSTKDISSKGNHAKLTKAPKWVSGKFGKALEFNGKDNCVQTEKKLLDAKTEFTILSWIKPGKLTANRIGFVGQNDSPEFGLSNPKTIMLWTPCNSVDTAFDFPAGEWHHIAAVASGSSVTGKIIDNTLISGSLLSTLGKTWTPYLTTIGLYDDEEDKEKVVDLKEIKKLLSVSSINEARQNLIAYKGADSYLEEIQKILEK